MCVMHLMKVLLNKFTTGDTESEAAVTAQIKELQVNYMSNDM